NADLTLRVGFVFVVFHVCRNRSGVSCRACEISAGGRATFIEKRSTSHNGVARTGLGDGDDGIVISRLVAVSANDHPQVERCGISRVHVVLRDRGGGSDGRIVWIHEADRQILRIGEWSEVRAIAYCKGHFSFPYIVTTSIRTSHSRAQR